MECFLEQLLLKKIQGHVITIEISRIKNIYGEDINVDSLPAKLQVLKTIAIEQKPLNTREIVKMLKNSDRENWLLIPSVIKAIKLLLVIGATSTTAERSFSAMRRLKTWSRSSMKQKTFNSLAILNFHKGMIHEISFVETNNTFANSGNLLPMMNYELFIFPNNNFFISFWNLDA